MAKWIMLNNDGIPDLVELGGVDNDDDGIVDVLMDSDGDGLVNDYDLINAVNSGVNEGTPHLLTGADSGDGTPVSPCSVSCSNDGDAIPPFLDLDSLTMDS